MGNNHSISAEAYKINMKSDFELGQGTFSTVYKIKNVKTKELSAGKIFKIPKKSMSNQDSVETDRELNILKTTNHPFIIKYIDEFDFN
jgi:serine/threonine protein kinase